MFCILPPGRSREGEASMPGRDQCPMQTGRGLRARGDLRGRGTRIEYDRKGKYSLYLGNVILPKMPYSDSGRRCWNQCPQYQLLAKKLLCSLPPALIYYFSPSLQYVTIKQSTIYLSLVNHHASNIPFFFRLLCFAYYLPGGPVKGGVHART